MTMHVAALVALASLAEERAEGLFWAGWISTALMEWQAHEEEVTALQEAKEWTVTA